MQIAKKISGVNGNILEREKFLKEPIATSGGTLGFYGILVEKP